MIRIGINTIKLNEKLRIMHNKNDRKIIILQNKNVVPILFYGYNNNYITINTISNNSIINQY